jgi:intracellular multiplication protein IcmM
MSSETWTLIKNSKNFNVRILRRGSSVLIASLVLNLIFGVSIFYRYLHLPPRDYYATSGITPPVMLTALKAPNYTAQALLPPDPPIENVEKVIPQ